jgi:hypothetical protein
MEEKMIDLTVAREIAKVLKWLLGLKPEQISSIKIETRELINDLSKSLQSLWDVTREIARLTQQEFNAETYSKVHDYFFSFYLAPEHIANARTHCTTVERTVDRILFKLEHFLHTDIGRWAEVRYQINQIVGTDSDILGGYDRSIQSLKVELDAIKDKLDRGENADAWASYSNLKDQLSSDIGSLGSDHGN